MLIKKCGAVLIRRHFSQHLPRMYFYFVDTRGRLFLEQTKHKNFTSCFKEKNFLNFFFKNLQPNHEYKEFDYPYYCKCMGEVNFLKPEDTPIVYREIDNDNFLIYGASLKYPFHPNDIVIAENGRLYHPSPLGSALIGEELTMRFPLEICDDQFFINWKGKKYLIKQK